MSLNHIGPLIGGGGGSSNSDGANESTAAAPTSSASQSVPECKVWRNSFNLFRSAEYQRFYWATKKEPLTYYDMNLSAQDHQTFFTCEEGDQHKPEYEMMQMAWRERNPVVRIKTAHHALEMSADCATAYILLAEEEATTIEEAEQLLRTALKIAEVNFKQSQYTQHQGHVHEAVHRQVLDG